MQDENLCKADVAIIGAGIMGASAAFQLSKHSNLNVVLIDQFPPLGGMSGRSFGQIRQHYSNELIVEMSKRGFEVFQNWDEEVGVGNPGYRRMGYLLLVVEEQMKALERNVALGRNLGVQTRIVDRDEIKKIEPGLNAASLAGGAYEENGGYIDVARMLLSWLCAAQTSGVKFLSGVNATHLETNGTRITKVVTDKGKITADIVIDTTGAWGGALLSSLDIQVPIRKIRLDTVYMQPKEGAPPLNTCITDGNSNVVIRPDMGRRILAVAYPKELPEVDDPRTEATPQDNADHFARLNTAFKERFPGLVGSEPETIVSGAYDVTPDFHPIMGWAPGVEGLYMAIGFSGHGLKLSPAVGEIIADAVLDKPSRFDVHPLRLERFVENDLMHLAYGANSARA